MKSADPLVSVVVPTYNRANLITDSLDSIAEQLYRPIEIIVIDDGSQDNTSYIVKLWCNTNEKQREITVKYIQQENQGGNAARNHGIREASGLFVAFLDSDDKWHSLKLQKQIQVFKNDPEIGAVYCGVQHVEMETGRITEPTARFYPQGWLLEKLLVHDVTAPTSTYVLRREVFDKVGYFDVTLQARQDWDMWIRLASEYKIGCIPEPLVDYREHSGLRTASNPDKEIYAYKCIMDKYAYLRKRCSLPIRQAAIASFYRRMGRVHFHQKHSWWQAFQFCIKAIVVWPFIFDSYAALAGLFMPTRLRTTIHRIWNRALGKTRFGIKSH